MTHRKTVGGAALRWTQLLLAITILFCGMASSPLTASAAGPGVILSAYTVKPGSSVGVIGAGFARFEQASVSICGASGQDGSAGCDLNDQVTLIAGNAGSLHASLRVGIPPIACPCAVVVEFGDSELSVPISIVGAPSAPFVPSQHLGPPNLRISGAQLRGTGPWQSWFGGPAHRTLTFTLHNSGPGILQTAPVVLSLHSWVGGVVFIKAFQTGTLGADRSRTYSVPFDLGPFAIGQYHVDAKIESFSKPVTFETSSLSIPYGLIVIGLILVQLILLAVRNVMRRRYERNNPRPPQEPVAGKAPPVEPLELPSVVPT